MKRVLGYVRVSTDNQDLKRQKDLIAEYCNKNHYELIHIEEDFAISGSVANRDGLNKVLAVDSSLYDMVVVCELSRISRQDDVVNTLQQIHQIISKVDLVILDEPDKVYKAGEVLNMIDFLTLSIRAYGAANERKKIKERMQSGIDTKFKDNVMMGVASVPYGFKLIDNPDYVRGRTPKKLFAVDDEAIKVIKQIYQYVLDGYSIRQITTALNNQSIKGKRFEQSNVRYILHNKFYNGWRTFKGQLYELPIKVIDDDTWNLVQEKMKSNRGYNHEAQIKHFNPLKGIAKCPCGANMTLIFTQNKGKYSLVISCANKSRRIKPYCPNSGMMAEVYFNVVWDDVRRNGIDESYKAKSTESINKLKTEVLKLNTYLPLKNISIEEKKKEIETVATNMALVTNPIALNTLNKKVDELQKELDTLIKEKNKLARQIARLNNRIKDEELSITNKELEDITDEGKAEIYKRVLERVTYYSFNGHHKGYLEIIYKNGYVSRYLYHNSNKNCYIWWIPDTFTIDRDKMTITAPSILPPNSPFTLNIKPKTYTISEFMKDYESMTYK